MNFRRVAKFSTPDCASEPAGNDSSDWLTVRMRTERKVTSSIHPDWLPMVQ